MTQELAHGGKIANVQMFDGVEIVRTIWTHDMKALGIEYDLVNHWLEHEVSPFMKDQVGDQGFQWFDLTSNDIDYCEDRLNNGMWLGGKHFHCIFMGWRDNKAHGWFVEDGGPTDPNGIDIHTKFKAITDVMKAFKYGNRILAELPLGCHMVKGHTVAVDQETKACLVRFPKGDIEVYFDDMKGKDWNEELVGLADGMLPCGPEAAEILGLGTGLGMGDAFAGTALPDKHAECDFVGVGKGHWQIIPWMKNRIRIIGPKTIMWSKKAFYFWNMGRLSPNMVPFTDAQAFWNFDFWREGLAEELATNYMRQVVEDAKDLPKLIGKFMRYSRQDNFQDVTGRPDLEAWGLRNSLAHGIYMPGTVRKISRFMLNQVMQCERGRIPMEGVAVYGHVLADPYAFDEFGMPHMDRCRIDDGEFVLVCDEIQPGTTCAVYRQPSSHDGEHVELTCVYSDGYEAFRNTGIALLGVGSRRVQERLQTADKDDVFIFVFNQVWRAAINQCSYPETEDLSGKPPVKSLSPVSTGFAAELRSMLPGTPTRYQPYWTKEHAIFQLETARQSRGGIGPVTNACGIDKMLSHPSYVKYISDWLDATGAPAIAKQWLLKRKPYQMAKYASNMGLIIDGAVKDATLLAPLGNVSNDLFKFHNGIRITNADGSYSYSTTTEAGVALYPQCVAGLIGRRGNNRIPPAKQQRGDYMLVETPPCACLKRIMAKREAVVELFKELEYAVLRPADLAILDAYPFNREVHNRVQFLGDVWFSQWEEDRKSNALGQQDPAAYTRIQRLFNTKVDEVSEGKPELLKSLAVDMYRSLYGDARPIVPAVMTGARTQEEKDQARRDARAARGRRQLLPQYDENGRLKSVGDAKLHTSRLLNALIDVAWEVGSSGAYVALSPDRKYRWVTRERRMAVKVVASSGTVMADALIEAGVVTSNPAPMIVMIKEDGLNQDWDGELDDWTRIGTTYTGVAGNFTMFYGVVEYRRPSEYLALPDLFQ